MKTEGQIRHKLKQVLFRHLKRRLAEGLAPVPENCLYNRQPSRWVEGRFGVWGPKPIPEAGPRICIHAEQAGVICDQAHDFTHDYARCPFFTPAKSKDQLKAEFVALARSSRDRVAETMPDAAALMWALDQESGVPEAQAEEATNGSTGEVPSEDDDEGDENEEPDPASPQFAEVRQVESPLFDVPENPGGRPHETPDALYPPVRATRWSRFTTWVRGLFRWRTEA